MSAADAARALDDAVCAAVSGGVRRDDVEHIVRMRQAGIDPEVGLAYPTTAPVSNVHAEPPRPLIRELPPADPFPVDALGEVLGARLGGRVFYRRNDIERYIEKLVWRHDGDEVLGVDSRIDPLFGASK